MNFNIIGKYGKYGQKEVVDEAETYEEAETYLYEYQMAFGSEWELWIEEA